MQIAFSHQQYLFFLFIVPILIFFHFFSLRNIQGKSLKFANFNAIARVKGIDLYSKNISGLILDVSIIIALVFALSGASIYKELSASSYSFVIAIDSSQSMSAKDLAPDRISAAKETAINFVEALPYETKTGVISFSGNSKIEQKLTKDKILIKEAVENIGVSNVAGTDINDAISNSIDLLSEEKEKAVILLSDGQINIGKIEEAIDSARQKNVIVNTIAIGTLSGGETSYGLSKLDEDSLKSLAYSTDGKFFNANNKQEMEESFKEIINETRKTGNVELSPYLMICAIILFIIRLFLVSLNKIMW